MSKVQLCLFECDAVYKLCQVVWHNSHILVISKISTAKSNFTLQVCEAFTILPLDFLFEEVTVVKMQLKQLLDWWNTKPLHIQNTKKDKRIVDLKRRVDGLEQYSRLNDVVTTGLQIKCAHAVTADSGGEPGELEVNSAEQQGAAFLYSRGTALDVVNIKACHPLNVNRKHKLAHMVQTSTEVERN